MGVMVSCEPDDRLRVTGDLNAEMTVPPGSERFHLAFSDGTLVEARYGDDGRYALEVAVEGAGIAELGRHDGCPMVRVSWSVDWVTVAPLSPAVSRSRIDYDREPPLDPSWLG